MGALAGLLKAAGHDVRGSDKAVYPPMSDQLRALNVPVFEGFSEENLDWSPDRVVVGNTCAKTHIEVVAATKRGLDISSLPETLSKEILAERHSMVVAGTHGKTTTTSLLSHILIAAGRDPSCFIGGVPVTMGKGWRFGAGEDVVVEGDEYDSAYFDKGSKFLHYVPRTAILTTVELDHVDIFNSMEEVRETFRKFVRLLPEDGLLVVGADSKEAMDIANTEAKCRVETFAMASEKAAGVTWVAHGLEYTKNGRCQFELRRNGELFDRYETILIGEHNVGNVVAAVAAAHARGVSNEAIRRGVTEFAGVRRRMEVKGIAQGVTIIDDYAHHPTAVVFTLRALRKRYPGRRLFVLYEPRTATSRRKTFQREYAEAFAHADVVVVGKLYDPSKIAEESRFDSERLALDLHQAGTKASYIAETADIVSHTVEEVRPGDVVLLLSTGQFNGLCNALISALGDAIIPAEPADMDDVRRVLSEVELDCEDLGDEQHRDFLVLRNENGFVGCVGLEVYGQDGILRSLAVTKSGRGVGYGWMLADTAIARARQRGVRRCYLLTETASDFFAAKHGFRVVVRSTIAKRVMDSTTFQRCPDSAVAMRLDL